jgi:ketosteroid isomerase-like protein
MTRHALAGIAGVLIGATILGACAPAGRPARSPGDEAAVRQTLIDWYAAYSGTDEAHYRSFVTDDYLLLEHGELMNTEDDLQAMRNRPGGYQRKDTFDFKSVRVHGDIAWATYFLESEMSDDTKVQQRRWLESAVLRHIDGRWRAALLHSTRISATDTLR